MSEPWPRTEQCEGLETWPAEWAALEQEALEHIESWRDQGADCGTQGKLTPAPPLARRSALDCAARFHAQDMAERQYLGRFDLEGRDEAARVEAAGGVASVLVQHLAAGPSDAETLIERTWLPRPVPCANLLSSTSTEIGLGYVGDVDDKYGTRWVVVLATP
ncbi:MAG: hypothetical protein KDK70_29520 [Myxococcales bacterium]|nr:hypothetical protein [Myxococcales bacterium]